MDNLWAPWRMKYIQEEANKQSTGCLFCPGIAADNDVENLIVHRARLTVVFMNKYPYNSGHLLVLPSRHMAELDDLDGEELYELFDMVRLSRRALEQVMQPHGFNIGINLGDVAGAGVPDHIHVHIVPRWNGDTNFLPVVGETKVISEHLSLTRDKLAEAFKDLSKKS